MPVDNRHPDFNKFAPRWADMDTAIDGEYAVKEQGAKRLPKTGGMEEDTTGQKYKAFKDRARFPDITQQALTGIVGLVYEKDPFGLDEAPITNTGQDNLELSREVLRMVAAHGREILVVDAGPDGKPYITRYSATSMINWKADPEKPGELSLAVFQEDHPDPKDLYDHEGKARFRRYLKLESGAIEVSTWERDKDVDIRIGKPVILPVKFMPIVVIGSLNLTPDCDPIPLMPVASCAYSYYMKSATYEQALWLVGQPTAWVSGVTDKQYERIRKLGIGAAALWWLGDDGRAGFLETQGRNIADVKEAMNDVLKQAESYAVRLTQDNDQVESGAALAKRAAAQHASIYSMADAVSIGLQKAIGMMAQWAGKTPPAELFKLRTDFEREYAGEQMINALNTAINAGNAPLSVMLEALRKSGLTDASDEEMLLEIQSRVL